MTVCYKKHWTCNNKLRGHACQYSTWHQNLTINIIKSARHRVHTMLRWVPNRGSTKDMSQLGLHIFKHQKILFRASLHFRLNAVKTQQWQHVSLPYVRRDNSNQKPIWTHQLRRLKSPDSGHTWSILINIRKHRPGGAKRQGNHEKQGDYHATSVVPKETTRQDSIQFHRMQRIARCWSSITPDGQIFISTKHNTPNSNEKNG